MCVRNDLTRQYGLSQRIRHYFNRLSHWPAKTSLAVALAYELGTEIISADSRQDNGRMDLGTKKRFGRLQNQRNDSALSPHRHRRTRHKIQSLSLSTRFFWKLLGAMRSRGLLSPVWRHGLYIESVIRLLQHQSCSTKCGVACGVGG